MQGIEGRDPDRHEDQHVDEQANQPGESLAARRRPQADPRPQPIDRNGVLMGMVTLASGAIYGWIGPAGYGVMSGVALIGLASAIWLYTQRERLLAALNPKAPA